MQVVLAPAAWVCALCGLPGGATGIIVDAAVPVLSLAGENHWLPSPMADH